MDDATIIKLFETQETRFESSLDRRDGAMKDFIMTTGNLNRVKLIGIIDPVAEDVSEIKEQNTVRNGRIDTLEKDVAPSRYVRRKPGRVVSIAACFILGIIVSSAFLAQRIDPEEVIENVTPLEFIDNEAQGSD